MSRKPARIKIVNLEDGMPTVEEARLRMNYELQNARREGCAAVKLIHGYGSSGAGGALRIGDYSNTGLNAPSQSAPGGPGGGAAN